VSTVHVAPEHEIREAAALWRADGAVDRAAVGWSRGPVHACRLPARWGRRKRWHYWGIITAREVVSLTLADLDYAGLGAIVVHDRVSARSWRDVRVAPLGWRGVTWPETAACGDVEVRRGDDFRLAFTDDGERVRLEARGRGVRVGVDVVRPPGHETLGVAVAKGERFAQYTSKQNALPARGWIELDGVRRRLADDAFACLDWGRGVWPAHTRWNWASASGRVASGPDAGRVIGLNLGAQWTDGGGANENALCVDGRLEKIGGDVRFEWDRRDPRRPWRLRSAGGDGGRPDVDLELVPSIVEGNAGPGGRPMPLVLCFGAFRGRVRDMEVRDLPGWAEEFDVLW
jgi:hypothetical protein